VYPDGKVCWGANHPAEASAKTLTEVWLLFISGSLFNADLTARKSRRYPQDIRQQLLATRRKHTYPVSDLQPIKLYAGEHWTAEKAIERHFIESHLI
jgi:hypothetical protein